MVQDLRAKEFGPKLRTVRERNGATPKRVASQLRVSPSMVSKWEKGHAFPARRRYVEFYAKDLGGGQELLDLYDRLKANGPNDRPSAVIEMYSKHRILPANPGDPVQEFTYHRIRAEQDLDHWTLTHTEEWVAEDDDYRLFHFGPGNLVLEYKQPILDAAHRTITVKHRVDFPEVLKAGQTIAFSTLRTFKKDLDAVMAKDEEGWVHVTPARWPIERWQASVRFLGRRPPHVWSYAIERNLAQSAGMMHRGEPLNLDKFGYVSSEWEKPRVGFAYGIGWRW